jgi:hypothetical protein
MTPHIIRLKGFWTCTTQADGHTSQTRAFGQPRTLSAGESLWLVLPQAGEAIVNGVSLGLGTEFDLTAHLQPRNRLQLSFPAHVIVEEVHLEVRRNEIGSCIINPLAPSPLGGEGWGEG